MTRAMKHEHEFEASVTVGGEGIYALVTVEVTGQYRPARWGYAGGDPPDYPDVRVVSASILDEDGQEVEVLGLLSRSDLERLENKALDIHERWLS